MGIRIGEVVWFAQAQRDMNVTNGDGSESFVLHKDIFQHKKKRDDLEIWLKDHLVNLGHVRLFRGIIQEAKTRQQAEKEKGKK